METGKIIKWYIRLRDQKKELEEKHKQELAPIKEKMELAEAALQKIMQDQGLTNLKTNGGTAYVVTEVQPKVVDWESTLEWIRKNSRWDVLERRVNKTQAKEEEIPGVQKTIRKKVNVRVS